TAYARPRLARVAQAAVEGALAAGATYAAARFGLTTHEGLQARNGVLEGLRQNESAGVGVRALIGSSWGFYAVAEPSETSARAAGVEAAEVAEASALVAGPPLALAEVPTIEAEWASAWQEHPHQVSLAEKADLLIGATATMIGVPGVKVSQAWLSAWDTQKWFVSSQGSRIFQQIVETGVTMN